jgi:membrane fusion protein, adhesin transport system
MIQIPSPDSPVRNQAPGAVVRLAVLAGLGLMLLLVAGAALWGWYGRLDVVSTALGEVVPSGQVKRVQHLEGGIIRAFLVKEGDLVKTDQPLLELEAASNDADVQELRVRIASLQADVARLKASSSNADDITFPDAFANNHADLVRRARAAFLSRRQRLENQVAAQKEAVVQRIGEENQTRARIKNDREQLVTVKEQLAIAEDLLRDELISRLKYLELKRESSALQGRINESTLSLKRLSAAKREAEFEAQAIRDDFAEEVRGDLAKKTLSLAEYTERMAKYRDSQRRTIIRSPADGIIKTLHVVTIGGVVSPGGLARIIHEGVD